jgi:pimeloyl-ACP methyl ester carboxylesterase
LLVSSSTIAYPFDYLDSSLILDDNKGILSTSGSDTHVVAYLNVMAAIRPSKTIPLILIEISIFHISTVVMKLKKSLHSIKPWGLLLIAVLIIQQSVSGQAGYHTVHSADGTAISYTKVGSGPVPIVLVHGALNSGEQWMQVAKALAEHCTCYVMDRWGRGGSGSHEDYSIKSEAEDIIAVLEAAGQDAFLLGHSSGAIYALEAALRTPVAGLILYEPPIHAFHGRFAKEIWESIQVAAKEERYKDALSIFLTKEAGVSDQELAFLQSIPSWNHMLNLTPQSVREWAELIRDKPNVGRYQEIKVSTLLLTGSKTINYPSFATQALYEMWPKARVTKLEGQGHGANLAAPEMVAKEITNFIFETHH